MNIPIKGLDGLTAWLDTQTAHRQIDRTSVFTGPRLSPTVVWDREKQQFVKRDGRETLLNERPERVPEAKATGSTKRGRMNELLVFAGKMSVEPYRNPTPEPETPQPVTGRGTVPRVAAAVCVAPTVPQPRWFTWPERVPVY